MASTGEIVSRFDTMYSFLSCARWGAARAAPHLAPDRVIGQDELRRGGAQHPADDGRHAPSIVGCSATPGYRDFRANGDAQDAVLAQSFTAFGPVLADAGASVLRRATHVPGAAGRRHGAAGAMLDVVALMRLLQAGADSPRALSGAVAAAA